MEIAILGTDLVRSIFNCAVLAAWSRAAPFKGSTRRAAGGPFDFTAKSDGSSVER